MDFHLFYRSSKILKPGEMKPPYSSMNRSKISDMKRSHSSHQSVTQNPEFPISKETNVNQFSQFSVHLYMIYLIQFIPSRIFDHLETNSF